MTPEQVITALHMLAGEWPAPAMNEAQTAAWTAHLSAWDFADVEAAIIDLIRVGTHDQRPTTSVMTTAVRAVQRRRQMAVPALPPAPWQPTGDHPSRFAELRRTLADAAERGARAQAASRRSPTEETNP